MEQSEWHVGTPASISINDIRETTKRAVIGLEAASAYWGMCTFSNDMQILLIPSLCGDMYFDGQLGFMFMEDFSTDYTVDLGGGLLITSRERTVCDMIKYKRHEFHLYETVLSAFEDGETDIELMKKIAESYGVIEELYEIYDNAIEDRDTEV